MDFKYNHLQALNNGRYHLFPVIFFLLMVAGCSSPANTESKPLLSGAERTAAYMPMLQGKNVGVVVNQSSMVHNNHLVDSLLTLGVNITAIFSPEHGFTGNADAGKHLDDTKHHINDIPIYSLYGKTYKPTSGMLEDMDILLFDLQDVGVRYYTYISTLHYVMEACAENNVPVVVLDRPNPNGFYIDGPMLEPGYQSFVGMHPVPLVYGMTIGEYATMINGEGWLADSILCELTVIKCAHYQRDTVIWLSQKPSPNLPNARAIYLYPSLGLFEGTVMSVGRGTDFPFEVYGHPLYPDTNFSFVPESRPGAALNPKYKNQTCYGVDLRVDTMAFKTKDTTHFTLDYALDAYQKMDMSSKFFNNYFNLLAGTDKLKTQILDGWDVKKIRSSWQEDLNQFKKVRKKYLLYPDVD